MNDETKYTSDLNYGRPEFNAGCVFTRAQWIQKGGTSSGLDGHIAHGYIREWEGQPNTFEAVKIEAVPENSSDKRQPNPFKVYSANVVPENSLEEESVEEVSIEPDKASKPQGVWCFQPEDLEGLELDALNAFYKDHASKYGISVRAYSDKTRLIEKMCSEA